MTRGLNCLMTRGSPRAYVVRHATPLVVAGAFVLPANASMRKRDSCPYIALCRHRSPFPYSHPMTTGTYEKDCLCAAAAAAVVLRFALVAPHDCSSFFPAQQCGVRAGYSSSRLPLVSYISHILPVSPLSSLATRTTPTCIART